MSRVGVSVPLFVGNWTVRSYEDQNFVVIVPSENGGDVTIYCDSPASAQIVAAALAQAGPHVLHSIISAKQPELPILAPDIPEVPIAKSN